jgi:hypothetical protein
MAGLRDLMGKEVYDLLYRHVDRDGNLISNFENVLFLDDQDIPPDRVELLKKLLQPVSSVKEILVPLEAAKLLAAWGIEEAFLYLEYLVNSRVDRLGNISPHRIYGYDTIYEEIQEAVIHYYAHRADRSVDEEKVVTKEIQPIVSRLLLLSGALRFNVSALLMLIKRENWREYESVLKELYRELIKVDKASASGHWNTQDLKNLLTDWDPKFA